MALTLDSSLSGFLKFLLLLGLLVAYVFMCRFWARLALSACFSLSKTDVEKKDLKRFSNFAGDGFAIWIFIGAIVEVSPVEMRALFFAVYLAIISALYAVVIRTWQRPEKRKYAGLFLALWAASVLSLVSIRCVFSLMVRLVE